MNSFKRNYYYYYYFIVITIVIIFVIISIIIIIISINNNYYVEMCFEDIWFSLGERSVLDILWEYCCFFP